MASRKGVCSTCGYIDLEDLLIYCMQCRIVAVHRYCVHGPPRLDDKDVEWSCEDCVPIMSNHPKPLRKSERVISTVNGVTQRKKAQNKWNKTISLQIVEEKQKSIDKATSYVGLKDLQPSATLFEDQPPLLKTNSTSNVGGGLNSFERVTFEEVGQSSSRSGITCCDPSLCQTTKYLRCVETHVDQRTKLKKEHGDQKRNNHHHRRRVCAKDEHKQSLVTIESNHGVLKRKKMFLIGEEFATCHGFSLAKTKKHSQSIGTHGDPQAKLVKDYGDKKANNYHHHVYIDDDKHGQFIVTIEGHRGTIKRKKTFVIEEDEEVGYFVRVRSLQPTTNGNSKCASAISPSLQSCSLFFAQPIFETIWRGCCTIKSDKYGSTSFGLEAHPSNKACFRVSEAASAFPTSLNFEIQPKGGEWPCRFQKAPPSDDDIALFFLPVYESDERLYDCLLEKMIDGDLVLKFGINYVKLLVASSLDLPQELWRFNRKYYMWGVFVQQAATRKLESNGVEWRQ